MPHQKRFPTHAAPLLLALCGAFTALPASAVLPAGAAPRPELNLGQNGPAQARSEAARQAAQARRSRLGHASVQDEQLGTTFLWGDAAPAASLRAGGVATALRTRSGAAQLARQHLLRHAGALQLSPASIDTGRLHDLHDTGTGPVIARLRQRVQGIDVLGRELNVAMARDGRLVAISGYFAPLDETSQAAASGFSWPAARAISQAAADLGLSVDTPRVAGSQGGYQHFRAAAVSARGQARGLGLTRDVRTKPVFFALGGRLEPSHYVELLAEDTRTGAPAEYAYVISAQDGRVLLRHNLVSHQAEPAAFSYRVHADSHGVPQDSPRGNADVPLASTQLPAGLAPFWPRARSLLTLASSPLISTRDPWLPPDATTTWGNNVQAYLNLGGGPGFQKLYDLRPKLTGTRSFDYQPGPTEAPTGSVAQMAAVVSLFYLNNWLHDFWYDRGFNEAAGNAQLDNLGRGGIAGDPVLAQGQDYSARNNASMSTPPDGSSPRMRMHLFDNPGGLSPLKVVSPEGLAGSVANAHASFGPAGYDVRGLLVPVTDDTAPVRDGCSTLTRSLTGRIALIERGTCTFATKVRNAEAAGAIGVVISNNVPGGTPPVLGGDGLAEPGIPAQSISYEDGQRLAQQSSTRPKVVMKRQPQADIDSSIDTGIVAHEHFHYVSNRLVGDALGLSNTQGRGMGEGWSDFATMLVQVRPEDAALPGNTQWSGIYPVGAYVMRDAYYGIRRLPYSTDMSVNPLTFRHIQNGEPLPTGVPIRGSSSTNAEVHNTGEIWALMLWEAYAGFLNDGRYSFEQARSRVQDYVIAGLKLTPVNPTMVEARNAILAVADATDDQDFLIWARAFAKRGLGVDAVAPNRFNPGNTGVVESYVAASPTP